MDKTEIRSRMRAMLKGLSPEEKEQLDHMLFLNTSSHPLLLKAGCIYAYASLSHEAGTGELLSWILSSGKRLALPRVEGASMAFYYVSSPKDLVKGAFGILEPNGMCQKACEKDAPVLVPGLAFTAAGQRLGKGGGYYDRFLAGEPLHRRIGIAYGFQLTKLLPEEPHDMRVQEIITPEGTVTRQINTAKAVTEKRESHVNGNRKKSQGGLVSPWEDGNGRKK